jgi:hypothetical protein
MDSDPEEEAFVTQLAEKLINQHEGGRVNFDDEDPDMEGWDDDSDEGDNEDDIANSTGSVNSVEESSASIQDIDGDSFMDIGSSEEDGEEEEEPLIDTDDDDNDDNLFEETGEKNKSLSLHKNEKKDDKKKVNRRQEAFVDADDYEELIAKSWAERDTLYKIDTKERVSEVKEYSSKKRKHEGRTVQRKKMV